MRLEEDNLRGVSGSRPHSPFDALLAVSGDAYPPQTYTEEIKRRATPTPSPPSKQSAASLDGGTIQMLSCSQLDTDGERNHCPPELEVEESQVQESRPEGVGTSGGGESVDNSSEDSLARDTEGEDYPREESSGIRTGPKTAGWGAHSPSHGHIGKKQRMIWTSELHERFLNAVNHLGMKNAVPKTILRMMNVEGMTRENVASHLQKYRLYLKRRADKAALASADAFRRPNMASAEHQSSAPVPSASNPLLQAPTSLGVPALGVPVGSAFPSCYPLSMSYIPPQAWAAGVPGYDALQALQSLCSQPGGPPASQAAPAGGGCMAASFGAAALAAATGFGASQPAVPKLEPPVLDIKPLERVPCSTAPSN